MDSPIHSEVPLLDLYIKSERNEVEEYDKIIKSEISLERIEIHSNEEGLMKFEECEINFSSVDVPHLDLCIKYENESDRGHKVSESEIEGMDDFEEVWIKLEESDIKLKNIQEESGRSSQHPKENEIKLETKEAPNHSQFRWYECDVCTYKSKTKYDLKKHMLVHKDPSQIQWYKCHMCDSKFKHKSNLNQHMLIHKDASVIRWYQCNICDFKSKQNNNLNQHKLIHKDPSQIRWYECTMCQYKSHRDSCVKRHMLTHKDPSEIQWYQCEICECKLKNKCTLKNHMLIHKQPSEIQWHECNICNYKCKIKSQLKRHLLAHKKKF